MKQSWTVVGGVLCVLVFMALAFLMRGSGAVGEGLASESDGRAQPPKSGAAPESIGGISELGAGAEAVGEERRPLLADVSVDESEMSTGAVNVFVLPAEVGEEVRSTSLFARQLFSEREGCEWGERRQVPVSGGGATRLLLEPGVWSVATDCSAAKMCVVKRSRSEIDLTVVESDLGEIVCRFTGSLEDGGLPVLVLQYAFEPSVRASAEAPEAHPAGGVLLRYAAREGSGSAYLEGGRGERSEIVGFSLKAGETLSLGALGWRDSRSVTVRVVHAGRQSETVAGVRVWCGPIRNDGRAHVGTWESTNEDGEAVFSVTHGHASVWGVLVEAPGCSYEWITIDGSELDFVQQEVRVAVKPAGGGTVSVACNLSGRGLAGARCFALCGPTAVFLGVTDGLGRLSVRTVPVGGELWILDEGYRQARVSWPKMGGEVSVELTPERIHVVRGVVDVAELVEVSGMRLRVGFEGEVMRTLARGALSRDGVFVVDVPLDWGWKEGRAFILEARGGEGVHARLQLDGLELGGESAVVLSPEEE